jgi:alanine racemase
MADMCTPAPDDLVRLGIGLYGLYPSAALAKTKGNLVLRPVLAWKTLLAQVKTLPARHPVGYGLTYITSRPMRVGIVPQGYSDGYDRGLSNVGEVLVGSRRCPVLGRIAMNMFAVDLSEVPEAKREDEVVLLGTQGPETISPEELAAKLGTINYEVIARISPQIHREIV